MTSKTKTSTKSGKKLASILLKLAKSNTLDHFNLQLNGKAGRIFKKSFILNKEGSALKIEVIDSTRLQKEIPSRKKGKKPTIEPIDFKEIKTGDRVYVNLGLTKEGEVRTKDVMIKPSAKHIK